jgi:hypothetical protein
MSRILMPDEPMTAGRFGDVLGDIAAAGIHDIFLAEKVMRAADHRCVGCSHPSHDPEGCTKRTVIVDGPCRCDHDRSRYYVPNGLPQ